MISDIEKAILELKDVEDAQLDSKREEIFSTICKEIGVNPIGKSQDILSCQEMSKQSKLFLAICLLRILCNRDDIIWQWTHRVKAFQFLDEHIGNIYSSFKIRISDSNLDKVQRLKDAEKSFFDHFEDISNSIVSLATAIDIRKRYMKSLNNPLYKLFIDVFVDGSLISSERIGELFDALINYQEVDLSKSLNAFEKAVEICNSLLEDSKKKPTIISHSCIDLIITRILEIIKNDFKKKDIIKPANVTVKPSDRKYPFHIKDKNIELKFKIHNEGPGYAFDVQVEIVEIDSGLTLIRNAVNLGTLEIGISEIIFEAKTDGSINHDASLLGQLSWNNFDSILNIIDFEFELPIQRIDLDWDSLINKQPYSLEAIQKEDDLVGRNEIIRTLVTKLMSASIESSIIYGQKRVGKTSIGKIIENKINSVPNYSAIFIPIGNLDKNTPEKFVSTLGKEISTEILNCYRFSSMTLESPHFDGALAPLIRFLKSIKSLRPEERFVIILDEFDEIPSDLYHYTNVGDTFFHNIRSISSEGYIGFILIGGENMQIIKQSTDRLNKFDTLRVDYFDKAKYWKDFHDLIKKPLKNTIEVHDEAIETLYEITEGNPFYTKLICRRLYANVCDSRNSFITKDDVDRAVSESISSLDANNVNHFWKDGIIVDDPARRDLIETQRRKFLIKYAEIKRTKTCVYDVDLINAESLKGDIAVENMLESFVNRGILIEENTCLKIRPKIIESWLLGRGIHIITSTFLDEKAIAFLKSKEDEAYINDQEIAEVIQGWGLYRGTKLTIPDVRIWLNQFDNNIERRLMFTLLRHLKFYSEAIVREKMRVVHKSIVRNLELTSIVTDSLKHERLQREVLISGIGQLCKSSPTYTRMYASENQITVYNVVLLDKIAEALKDKPRIKAIVFIDDLIASGETTIDTIETIKDKLGSLLSERNIKLVIAAICATRWGLEKVENAIAKNNFNIEVSYGDLLTETNQCFSDSSICFEKVEERLMAKKIALEYGGKLQKKHPLGYNDGQLLVTFSDSCPNNTLPIFWCHSSSNPKWAPLFRRN